jgi:hypothetical protein
MSMTAEFPEDLLGELANLVAQSGPLGIVGIANKFLKNALGPSVDVKLLQKSKK